tara:strand:- start:1891 stop:2052 length:162 start_codon:yes stop_codon:yes gene_type:complete
LDLIKKKKKVFLFTKILHTPEEFGSRQMNSALALNRFKHDGTGGRSYRGGKRF